MEIIESTMHHILDMVENITDEDYQEFKKYRSIVLKQESVSLLETLLEATNHQIVYTMIHNDQVMAMGGESMGCVWFLTSNALSEQNKETKKEFIKVMNEHKERVLDEAGMIWNFIWEGNKTHINFIKLMGAEFPEIDPKDKPDEFKFFMIKRK